MFHSKEHLIRGSDPSLWGFAGLDFNDNESQKLSSRIWNLVNSKLFNAFVVLFVVIESSVIICQTLIDSKWIQDPSWKVLTNCTNTTSNTTTYDNNNQSQISPTLLTAKRLLTYTSLTIISLFFIEILLRIYSGKLKLFIQPFELLDALLVNVLFILSIVFFLHNSRDKNEDKNGGQKCILLIVLLRMWRILKIVQTLIEESQQKLIQILNVCEKEKSHAEHKIDILILKVEDLEHEVAYLKEKLKKTDRDNSAYIQQLIDGKTKKTAKRTQSSHSSISTASYCPCRKQSFKTKSHSHNQQNHRSLEQNDYTLVDIEAEPNISKINKTNDLNHFARNLAQSITSDVMRAIIQRNNSRYKCSQNEDISKSQNVVHLKSMRSVSNKTSPLSSYNYMNSLIKPSLCNESHINSRLYLISNESNHSQESKMKSNLNSCIAAHQLNEELEIERIKKVEFNCNDLDIPLSSL